MSLLKTIIRKPGYFIHYSLFYSLNRMVNLCTMFYRLMGHQFNVKVVCLSTHVFMFEFQNCKCIYASFVVLVKTIPRSSRNMHTFQNKNRLTCTFIFFFYHFYRNLSTLVLVIFHFKH